MIFPWLPSIQMNKNFKKKTFKKKYLTGKKWKKPEQEIPLPAQTW